MRASSGYGQMPDSCSGVEGRLCIYSRGQCGAIPVGTLVNIHRFLRGNRRHEPKKRRVHSLKTGRAMSCALRAPALESPPAPLLPEGFTPQNPRFEGTQHIAGPSNYLDPRSRRIDSARPPPLDWRTAFPLLAFSFFFEPFLARSAPRRGNLPRLRCCRRVSRHRTRVSKERRISQAHTTIWTRAVAESIPPDRRR